MVPFQESVNAGSIEYANGHGLEKDDDVEEEAGCSYEMSNGGPPSSDEGASGPSPPKRKRTELTVSAKLDLIDRYRRLDVKSRRQAAVLLNVSHGFLNQVLKKEADLRDGVPTKIRNRCGKDKEIEDGLLRWLREASVAGGPPMSGALLCQKAEEIAARLGKPDFKATDGWLNRWKKRNSLLLPRKRRSDGEAAESLDELLSSYPPSCVYCAEAVPLCYRVLPGDVALGAPGQRLTLLLCCSLTGEKEALVVIGGEAAPRCFHGVKALPVSYRSSRHARLTKDVWNDWLQAWNARLRAEMRRVLLLVPDNAAYVSVAKLSHVAVHAMEANMAMMLPMELGVTKATKGFYRRALQQRLLDLQEDCSDTMTAGEVLKKLTLLDAMYLLSTAWRKVNAATIMQCWHDAGFQASSTDPEGNHDPKPPPGLTAENFHVWVSVDDHLLAAMEDDNADLLQVKEEEEEEEEKDKAVIPTPSKSVMRVALHVLRIGLERRGFAHLDTFCLLEEDVRECLRMEKNA